MGFRVDSARGNYYGFHKNRHPQWSGSPRHSLHRLSRAAERPPEAVPRASSGDSTAVQESKGLKGVARSRRGFIMARRRRVLTAAETRGLEKAILEAIPGSRRKAITRRSLYRRLRPHLQDRGIPVSGAERLLLSLKKAGKVNISTRVGMWTGPDDRPKVPQGTRKGTLRFPQRRIRRVIGSSAPAASERFPPGPRRRST